MNARIARAVAYLAIVSAVAPTNSKAGTYIIPSDVAFTMSAEPNSGIEPGDLVTLTLSATNLGPQPVATVELLSTHFVDELDLATASTTCHDFGQIVTDLGNGFYYEFEWYPADEQTGSTFVVGQTKTCTLTFALTAHAPDVYPFRFYIPEFLQDINPANDSATVYLRRAPAAPPKPVTANGQITALLLAGLLVLVGAVALAATRRQCRRSARS